MSLPGQTNDATSTMTASTRAHAAGLAVPPAEIERPARRRRVRANAAQQLPLGQQIAAYTVLTLGSLLFLIPFYFVVNASLKTDAEVKAGNVVAPVIDPQWQNYPQSLDKLGMTTAGGMPRFPALSNTIVITVLTIAGQIFSCSLVGFGFARFRFRGRGILFMLMLSTMMLPAQVTMIPVFVLFRSLGLVDTIWPLVIPAWLASPFFVFMFRQFFSQVPEELLEAAKIDGCSNWRIYWQIMLPLSGPVIAIVAIYTFLGAWNDFMGPLIYLNSPENRTLALAINSFRGQYGSSDAHLLMAASVAVMIPSVLLFFAAQRYFVESVAQTGGK
ncbi:MAG TPA: carbohydrate ABC transporter permease [Tepidisphaeraceae bacterium]|nr:carbohydrate ABC transporter permease [Tepidisphaeraceae bacterium]